MVDRLLPSFDGMLPFSADEGETEQQAQSRISALPTIRGVLQPPGGDLTERVDGSGRVYRWEPTRDGAGFWVYAGFIPAGRLRLPQPIDPHDIRWLDMKTYRMRVTIAARRISAAAPARGPEDRPTGVLPAAADDIVRSRRRPGPAGDAAPPDDI